MLSQLIQRLRDARSQRRLLTGERGAIAASLVEIGVAMLAVGILTAGAVTSFIGFIDSASDSTARGRLTDASATADQVYNWLRPGGQRCYSDTACANTNETAASALQEAAGGQLTFAEWPSITPGFDAENTIYVQVTTWAGSPLANIYLLENNLSTTTHHNGIAGNPADGQWIRLAVRSDSGATFCTVKIAHTDDPIYEGVGYMSVNSDDSGAANTSAHCGGHNGKTGELPVITAASCVFGSEGASTTNADNTAVRGAGATEMGVAAAPATVDDACATDRALGRPGAGTNITP